MQERPAPTFGPVLAEIRRHYGVDQREVAEALGVTTRTLSRWEKADARVTLLRVGQYEVACQAIVDAKTAKLLETVA